MYESKTNVTMVALQAIVVGALMVGIFLAVSVIAAHSQSAPQTTLRDAGGRTIGTATTSDGGSGVTTTFRDAGGRTTGTATTTPGGLTTYRDSSGRTTGTASSPRK